MRNFGITRGVVAATLLLTLGACGTGAVGPVSSNQTPSSDTTSPTVSITSPSSTGSYSTSSAVVSLAGTASDNVGVVSVTWRNAANGASGNATGTTSWSIASIALVSSGVNTITVTVRDGAGNAGGATLAVTYNPGGTASLSGGVDSSLINRGNGAVNAVYLYNGTVLPDDLGSPTPPVATTQVTQDSGACTFGYRFGALPAGTYTVAFTGQAANDGPGTNDAITFLGAATVTIAASGTTTHDFLPGRRLQVGPTRTFTVPSAAIAAAQTGDVIEIDAGEYVDDNSVWGASNLTLRGVGGRAHMRSTQLISNGKGIWVTSNNATVENIEFSGAAVSVGDGENGAGIRADGSGLTVCNGYFHDNQNGILDGSGVVLVEYSEFDNNGHCPPPQTGNGCTHNMYFSTTVTRFTLRYSYSHRAHEGHLVKSRALENHILYNRLTDETGDASYEIDLPNGGLSFIIGNMIEQSVNTGNSAIIAFGEEGVTAGHQTELYVVNNTIVNDLGSGAFVSLPGGTTGSIVNNIFAGGGGVPASSGTLTVTGNLISNTPGLVDALNFDYHLTSTSPAVNTGVNPGSAGSVSLIPTSQYLHPINREDRPSDGLIDIGAYEFH